MALLTLVTHPHPVLKMKGEKIKDSMATEIQSLIRDMFETMRAEKGVGLAAQQVGKALQLAVIEVGGKRYTLINPKITSLSKEMERMDEGCLSVPGEFFRIQRHSHVTVRYTDENGEKQKLRAYGLLGETVQHEVDHLNGIIILDHTKSTKEKLNKISDR